MSTFRTGLAAIAAALLAVGCGGGGGDGGGGNDGGIIQPTQVLISAANQDTVARASVASIMPFVNVPVGTSAAGASAAAPPRGLTQLAVRTVKSVPPTSQPAPAGMARPLAMYQKSWQCTVSGSVTAVLDDRDDNQTISAGDSISMSFNQCDDDVGVIANGSMGMVIAAYTLTPSVEDMSGSMAFQSMTLADPSGSVAMNGGFSFRLTATTRADGAELLGSFTIADVGLTVSKQGGAGGLSDTFTYRSGYAVTERDFIGIPGVASSRVMSASGGFRSETLGGDLSLTTTTPFRSTNTEAPGTVYPTEGQLVATGRNNTKLGLTATATAQVRTDMCDDGDNEWEASKMATWDWLLE